MINKRIKHGINPEKKRLAITLAIFSMVILFFLGIITLYYSMVESVTRESIISKGELNAANTANKIDKFLTTGVESMELMGYSLDSMLRDNRSSADILTYLADLSGVIPNHIEGQINGIYGYINGEYLDGSFWEPDEDFVPTERPWYLLAKDQAGKVMVIDPYIDAMTGSSVITLSKALGDGKSVFAMDITMDRLQTTVEEVAASGDSDMEIILTRNYTVIAHSDRAEIGKDYTEKNDTLGSAITQRLSEQSADNRWFSVRYDNSEYIVYAVTIENDWVFLSVINATAEFARPRLPLMFTILISVITIFVMTALMFHSIREDRLAREMKQLADQQTEKAYIDQMTGLKNRRAYSEALERLSDDMPEDGIMIMFDVNGLKTINDARGHDAGDELIIAAATCIRDCFADSGEVFRLGGDEFCLIFRGTVEEAAASLKALETRAAQWKGNAISGFSISWGMASVSECPDVDALTHEADRRMYEYKGRFYNRKENDRRKSRR